MPTSATSSSSAPSLSITLSSSAKDDIDSPSWRDPISRGQLALWRKCREAFDGTDAMLANARVYLPKHKKEKPEDYRIRVEHSAAFNSYGATIGGLVGLAFAKPPSIGKDVPKLIRDHAENIDGRGTHLDVFARDLTEDGLVVGSTAFAVLYPPRPEGATAHDEHTGVLRPYWSSIGVEDILSWQFTQIGAQERLTQIVFEEKVRARAGRFGSKVVTRYRVFSQDIEMIGLNAPVQYEVWEKREGTGTGANRKEQIVRMDHGMLVNGKNQPFSRIPIVFVNVGRKTSPVTARPPLKDLLDLMLKAFRIDSDRTHLMHSACLPIPVRKGYRPPTDSNGKAMPSATAAVNVLMDLPGDTKDFTGSNFFWAEITGNAFVPTADELSKLKAEQGALGLSFLAPSTRAAETAEARRLDQRIENASLSSTMSAVDSAIEEGFILHAEYEGLELVASGEKSGGSYATNRDFERTVLGADMIKVFSDLVLSDQLTLETLHEILQRGRVLPDGFDSAKEIRKLTLLSNAKEKELDLGTDDLASKEDPPQVADPANPPPPPPKEPEKAPDSESLRPAA